MIFSVLSSLVIIEPLIIFRKFFTGFFFAEQTVIQNAHLRIMCILFFEPLCSFYEIPAGVLRGTGHSLSPAIACNYRNLLFSYYLDIYYFRGILPIKCSVLCLSYLMDTNDCSYYDRLCYCY